MSAVSLAAWILTSSLLQAASPAADPPSIAAWTLNNLVRQTVPDVSGHRHQATCVSNAALTPAPGGKAAVFDGRQTALQVADHADLRMTDCLTIDLWVRLDERNPSGAQCLIDKGGERYRIQIAGDHVTFGLKNDHSRMDLTGGRLTAGSWHRITAVFQRPRAMLFVDGKVVGQRMWDEEIGVGGDLWIGAQSGAAYFFKGQIDEVRIYRAARPPEAADAPVSISYRPDAGDRNAVLRVDDRPDGVEVDTGPIHFALGNDATLRLLAFGKKVLVKENRAPLLAAEVFASEGYDGFADAAAGTTISGLWQAKRHAYRKSEQEFSASFVGALGFPDGDALDAELILTARRGSPFLTLSVQLEAKGTFQHRFVRRAWVQLPLALAQRKRIVQAGDRGVQWDTRHWYQFHVSPVGTLLREPDHNLWRIFAIDQTTPSDYQLWRAESPATAPLSMQRGIAAPGWMAAYDEQAGLLFAYRGFNKRTPKSLRVLAEGGGQAQVDLWPAGQPALHPRAPQASAAFGKPHVIDWLPFTGQMDHCPDIALAEHWGVSELASDPPARNEPAEPLAPTVLDAGESLAAEDLLLQRVPPLDARGPLVAGGVPLPRGELGSAQHVRLRRDGADVPLQTRALAYWPDRSIKWLLLVFPGDGGAVTGAAGEGKTVPLVLNRRDGWSPQYQLIYGKSVQAGTPKVVLSARQAADRVVVDTGPLQVEMGPGRQWFRNARLEGREMLAAEGAGSFVDFLRTTSPYACLTTHPQGTPDDGPLVVDRVELEEAGPLRAVVRLEGMTTAKEPSRVIVRVEAYAGRSVVRVFHSVEFLHQDPRSTFVRRMGLELPLARGEYSQVTLGGQDGPVPVFASAPLVRAGLKQHSHLGYQAWQQHAGERFLRWLEQKERSRGWIDLGGPSGGAAVVLRDMWQQFPNELVADATNSRLTAYLWPESGPLMDVRRYSNYPHPAQGESASPDSDWVEKRYHAVGPFVGVSKTHELLLYFHTRHVTPDLVERVAADFQRPPLVFAGGDWNVRSGVILRQSAPSAAGFDRTHANLDHYARFWMHQQRLWGWYGFWDYGDVQHHYKTGYGSIIPADKLADILHNHPKDYQTVKVAGFHVQDYVPQHEWASDNGRWGWNNTEGLPGLYMQNQYLRAGDRAQFFFAEAMARHFRDVDMRHDGRWLGLGTRHGVQHWSDGNHEERQTTHSEFRYIYGLTGDARSRDFARQLFEKVYSQRPVSIHAAHSGRLQGLLTWWEMTGSDAVGQLLGKYVPTFLRDDGICLSPAVRFPEVRCLSQEKDVNTSNMFFWTFGAGHGLLEYYYLTEDPRLRRSLLAVAEVAMKRDPDPGNYCQAVSFAARHAADPQPYRRYLAAWAGQSPYVVQVVPHNPKVYGGPHGMLHGSVSGSLFAMNAVPYLLGVFDGDPKFSPRQWERLKQIDAAGVPAPRSFPGDWQSAYDRPELSEYLRIKNRQP